VVFLVVLDAFSRETLLAFPEFVVRHDAPEDDIAVAYPPQDSAELHRCLGLPEDCDKSPVFDVLHGPLATGRWSTYRLQDSPVLLERSRATDGFKCQGQKTELQELLLLVALPPGGELQVVEAIRVQDHFAVQVGVIDGAL